MKVLSQTSADLAVLKRKLEENDIVGLDYETTSGHPLQDAPLHFDKAVLCGYGLAFLDGSKTYVPVRHKDGNAPMEEALGILEYLLGDPNKVIWAHNAKFELMISRAAHMEVRARFLCSYIGAWLLNLGRKYYHGLKGLAKEFLQHDMTTWEEVSVGQRAHSVPVETMAPYCADDAWQTLRLGESLMKPMLVEQQQWKVFEELECRFIEVLVHMNECGFKVDEKRLRALHDEFKAIEGEGARKFYELCGVSVASSSAVSQRLYHELKWWPTEGLKKGKSGAISVDAGTREKLFPRLKPGSLGMQALEIKSNHSTFQKLRSTYTLSLAKLAGEYGDKRIRCEFHQAGTETGRLSSKKPNLQAIPRKGEGIVIRDAFVADTEDGWVLCDADYSQADLVMMAHLSQDERMLKAYRDNIDLHQQTADICGCDRDTGKVLNLGLIYEMSAGTLAANLKISQEKGKILWQNWHRGYPRVRDYQEAMHAYVEEHFYVRTITGRRRFLPELKDAEGYKRVLALHAASNTPSQGSVADVIKIAMRNLYYEWKEKGVLFNIHTGEGKAKILSQVHDELICELKEDFAEEGMRDIQRHMENAVQLRAPMRAEPGLGANWNDAKNDGDRRAKAKRSKDV